MIGPEHYREAERLAEVYKQAMSELDKMPSDTEKQRMDRLHAQRNVEDLLTKARLHADLARIGADVARLLPELQLRWLEVLA